MMMMMTPNLPPNPSPMAGTTGLQPWIGFAICVVSLVGTIFIAHIPLPILFQPMALLLVIGGTLGALCLSNPFMAVVNAFKQAIFPPAAQHITPHKLENLVADLVDIATFARKEGLIALAPYLEPLATTEPFLFTCLQRLSDNKPYTQLEADLNKLLQQRCNNALQPIHILEQAAGYLPTMGLMGALLGILQVFSQTGMGATPSTSISTDTTIMQAMPFSTELSASFSATLLGLALANWVCLPLAQIQQQRFQHLQQKYALIVEAVLAIHQNEHPLQLTERLRLYLQNAETDIYYNTTELVNPTEADIPAYNNPIQQPAGVSRPNQPQTTRPLDTATLLPASKPIR
jgi:chemotaxis protein MotA